MKNSLLNQFIYLVNLKKNFSCSKCLGYTLDCLESCLNNIIRQSEVDSK